MRLNFKKQRNLVATLALAMLGTSLLSACGGTASGSGSNQPVTLKIMIVDYVKDKTDKWLQDTVIPAYQKDHPNVTIQPTYVTWGTLDETVQGYFTAGDGADIINLGSEYIAQYGDRLAPLNQYLGESAWPDIKQYVQSTLDTVTWKGELRGLPWLTAPRAYMCRTDMSKTTSNYADSIAQAKAGTKIENNALKTAGLVTTGRLDDWQEYIQLIWGEGAKLYQDNGTPNFNTPEAKAALKFMYDRRRGVYPTETVADLPESKTSRLSDGTAACIWGNLWGAPATSDALWNQIDIAPSPTNPDFPNAKPVVQVFNDWLAIPAYSKHIAEAADFLKYLGSADNQNRYNSDFGSFPPRKDAWTGYVANDKIMQKLGDLMIKYGMGFADIRESAKLREILQKEMPAYFTDTQDLDTTLKNIQDQYTQVLKDAKRIQ